MCIRDRNDTIVLKKGVLGIYLLFLEKYRNQKPLLFFYNNNERQNNEIITCTSLNQFVSATSYYIGWTLNFGAWKVHFEGLENKNRCSYLQFMQIDWSLRMLNNNNCIINFGDWIEMQYTNKKGGYNLFEVHVDNYLFLFT